MYSQSPRTAIRFTKIKPSYSWISEYDLHVLNNQLIPFQIRRTARPNAITVFKTVRLDGLAEEDLIAILDVQPYISSFVGYDTIIYKADQNTVDFASGRCYLEISDGVDTWYSMNIINIPCYALVNPVPQPLGDGIDEIIAEDGNVIIS